ncbi:MAG: ATP-dependent helicase C-terminal domain-containing protein, partial [Verrucomicrobiota bacterium]
LCEAEQQGCVDAIIVIAALVQGRSIIIPLKDRRKDRERKAWMDAAPDSEKSDFIALLEIWKRLEQERFNPGFCREWGIHFTGAQQAARTAQQLIQQAERAGIQPHNDLTTYPSLGRSILSGFPDQVGRRLDRGTLRCELVGGRRGDIRRESAVQDATIFVATEIDERTTAKGVNTFINGVTAIDPKWLEELFPDTVQTQKSVRFDKVKQGLIGIEATQYRDLTLAENETQEIDHEGAAELFADKILSGEWKLKHWDHSVDQWIERVNCIAQWSPDSGFSTVDEAGKRMILAEICSGSLRFKEIQNKPVWPAIKAWLPDMLLPLLDHLAPETFQLPNRHKPIKLRYESKHPRVVLASMVQDFYDVEPESLKICDGQIALTLEMLAPNRRPVQLTNDLQGFWERSYPQIKKDLAGRYPKHEWR